MRDDTGSFACGAECVSFRPCSAMASQDRPESLPGSAKLRRDKPIPLRIGIELVAPCKTDSAISGTAPSRRFGFRRHAEGHWGQGDEYGTPDHQRLLLRWRGQLPGGGVGGRGDGRRGVRVRPADGWNDRVNH